MKRVVFTVARGEPRFAEMAMGLGRSLHLLGDDTPRAVLTDIEDYDWLRYFDYVIKPDKPRSALDKLVALEHTDADAVLSLDGDSLAFKRLDPVFNYMQGKSFAVQGDYHDKGKWHGADVAEMCKKLGVSAMPRFNGGLIYYERGEEAESLISEMHRIEGDYENSGFELFRENPSEEVCVVLAMIQSGKGHLVPDETDFMSTGVGLIGKLHMDIMKAECRFLCRRRNARYIEPYIFHAARYVNFVIYWKQLDKLKALEKFEDMYPNGYLSRGRKMRRSFEKRFLKLIGKN